MHPMNKTLSELCQDVYFDMNATLREKAMSTKAAEMLEHNIELVGELSSLRRRVAELELQVNL